MMRGITVREFGGPEVLQYVEDLPSPPKPSDNQVLISVKAAGVNPVDTYIRTGGHPFKPALPYTPGNDGCGIVEEVGSNVTKFKKGDRVYWTQHQASYAEKVLQNDQFVFHLSNKLTFSQGAAVGTPYFTAYRALITKAKLKPGERVFIHGASGGVGTACVQIARYLGAQVFGTAGTDEGLELVLKNGAHQAFNHRKEGYMNEITEKVPEGFDVVIEMLADVNLEKDLDVLSTEGRIVILGSRGSIEVKPNPCKRILCEAVVMVAMLFKAKPAEWAEMGAFFDAGQELGWLKPVVGQEYRLEQASEAHKQVMEHSGGSHGKIVLTV